LPIDTQVTTVAGRGRGGAGGATHPALDFAQELRSPGPALRLLGACAPPSRWPCQVPRRSFRGKRQGVPPASPDVAMAVASLTLREHAPRSAYRQCVGPAASCGRHSPHEVFTRRSLRTVQAAGARGTPRRCARDTRLVRTLEYESLGKLRALTHRLVTSHPVP
jgi:hypothetical protein